MKKLKGIQIWRCLSLAWLLFLSVAYYWPSDALYAITIWPPFVWAGLAFVLSFAGLRRHRSRSQIFLLVSWIVFWIGFGEEKHFALNRISVVKEVQWKVITLNCAGGSFEAAEEAFELTPDILFLQESPSRPELEKLAARYYKTGYQVLWGVDASIIVKAGSLRSIVEDMAHTTAVYQTQDGESVILCSLRLSPPVFRLDYWNPDCWRAYAVNRELHRKELADINYSVWSQTDTFDVIVAGDFNWTPDSEMRKILLDLSPISNGSGYTAVNEFPLARIDQIWASSRFRAKSKAIRTKNSDHRMVVCEIARFR